MRALREGAAMSCVASYKGHCDERGCCPCTRHVQRSYGKQHGTARERGDASQRRETKLSGNNSVRSWTCRYNAFVRGVCVDVPGIA